MHGPEVIIIPLVFAMPTLLVLVKMWLGYRERQSARQGLPPSAAAAIEARLDRIERAVDAVAIEMERLGEGQRFTARLLAERGSPVADPPRRLEQRPEHRPAITPH